MNIAHLQKEIQALSPQQQNRISAFLVGLRLKREGQLHSDSKQAQKEEWVSWEELKPELEQ